MHDLRNSELYANKIVTMVKHRKTLLLIISHLKCPLNWTENVYWELCWKAQVWLVIALGTCRSNQIRQIRARLIYDSTLLCVKCSHSKRFPTLCGEHTVHFLEVCLLLIGWVLVENTLWSEATALYAFLQLTPERIQQPSKCMSGFPQAFIELSAMNHPHPPSHTHTHAHTHGTFSFSHNCTSP